MQNLSTPQYYLYLVFYNVVYVIPLAVIVGAFAWKMGGRKMSEKEGRILKLVGGILMLALGIILLFKHELLMFG
jgi:cytochrome c biogenesis protein CcdA